MWCRSERRKVKRKTIWLRLPFAYPHHQHRTQDRQPHLFAKDCHTFLMANVHTFIFLDGFQHTTLARLCFVFCYAKYQNERESSKRLKHNTTRKNVRQEKLSEKLNAKRKPMAFQSSDGCSTFIVAPPMCASE